MSQDLFKQEFQNKVVLVTGAASGIGACTAEAFARAGASVVLSDVSADQGETQAQLLRNQGLKALFVKADVAREDDVRAMVAACLKQYGKIDLAFNNAGVEGTPSDTATCTNENWERTINTNLRGVWWCMKYELQEMLKNKSGGAIVNCSSIAGVVGFAGVPAYVASKHGVIGLTKTAALEYAAKNIRVNAVCPGVIHTPMIDRFTGGDSTAMKSLADGAPVGRLGTPAEIASAVLWLCSSGATFVNGHALVADGGWVAR